MRKLISVLLCGAFAAAFGLSAAAREPGDASRGQSASAPGGPAAGSQALENSNGRFATDRDKGLDRAEDRMSEQGLRHQKATEAQKKRRKPGPEESSAGSMKE